MRAVASITLEDELAVHDIKVIEGPDRFFLAMPSRKMPDGSFQDIVHPITSTMREDMEKVILQHYHEAMNTPAHD